jgi:hypothetical protein
MGGYHHDKARDPPHGVRAIYPEEMIGHTQRCHSSP